MCKTHEIHNIFEDNELLCKQINIHCGNFEKLLIHFGIKYLIEGGINMIKINIKGFLENWVNELILMTRIN